MAQEVPAEVAVAPVKKNFMEAVSLRTKATTEHFLIGNGMTRQRLQYQMNEMNLIPTKESKHVLV